MSKRTSRSRGRTACQCVPQLSLFESLNEAKASSIGEILGRSVAAAGGRVNQFKQPVDNIDICMPIGLGAGGSTIGVDRNHNRFATPMLPPASLDKRAALILPDEARELELSTLSAAEAGRPIIGDCKEMLLALAGLPVTIHSLNQWFEPASETTLPPTEWTGFRKPIAASDILHEEFLLRVTALRTCGVTHWNYTPSLNTNRETNSIVAPYSPQLLNMRLLKQDSEINHLYCRRVFKSCQAQTPIPLVPVTRCGPIPLARPVRLLWGLYQPLALWDAGTLGCALLPETQS